MLARNIKLSWAKYEKINIAEIEHDLGRFFVRELKNTPKHIIIDAYVCSDARNHFVRQVLTHIPYVNVLNSAGNVVYSPHERPSIIIAHGDSGYKGCGAIDYSFEHSEEDELGYPYIAELEADPLQNAKEQLKQINPEWRAGIVYFNHQDGTVELVDGDYNKYGIGIALFSELKKTLRSGFTDKELKQMASGQNPEIIFLNNIYSDLTVFNFFEINLQRDSFHGIIHDSLKYAMEHSLRGTGSFKDTQVCVMAFRRDEPIPEELQYLLNRERFVRDYINRGGKIYIVTVGDLPSTKAVYRIKKKTKTIKKNDVKKGGDNTPATSV
jgi:hypothetical protein